MTGFKQKAWEPYTESLKQLWTKQTLRYFAIDFGMILLAFGSFLLCIYLFRQSYFEFVKAVPAFNQLATTLQQQPGMAGVDLNLMKPQLEVARQATYKLVGYTIGAFGFLAILESLILGIGNSYIWGMMEKKKNNLKRMLNFSYMTLLLIPIWLLLFIATALILKNLYIVPAFALLIVIMPYSFSIAHSFTSKKFWRSLKKAFSKPFINIPNHLLLINLSTISHTP